MNEHRNEKRKDHVWDGSGNFTVQVGFARGFVTEEKGTVYVRL